MANFIDPSSIEPMSILPSTLAGSNAAACRAILSCRKPHIQAAPHRSGLLRGLRLYAADSTWMTRFSIMPPVFSA
jgi:hypothetical protein